MHPDHEVNIRDRWQHSLRTGEPFAAEYRLRTKARRARYRWFLVNGCRRGQGGDVVAWIGTCTDVDTQKRLEEREAFLARAGERLGASLDVTATVAAMKSLLIPRLAERTWVALLDDEGALRAHRAGQHRSLRRARHAPLDRCPVAASAARRGRRHRRGRRAGGPRQAGPFPRPWVRDLPAGARDDRPLVSADVTIGALALVRSGGRAYDLDDIALVREFARRAALSLEHARLYERERTTADALQRAMLPAQLPLLPNFRFSASYSSQRRNPSASAAISTMRSSSPTGASRLRSAT